MQTSISDTASTCTVSPLALSALGIAFSPLALSALGVAFSSFTGPSMSRVVRLLEGTEEVKLPPNPFLMHMDSSSEVTESVRREDEEDKISRTTLGPFENDNHQEELKENDEDKLPPNPFLCMGSSSAVTEENDAVNVTRIKPTTVGPWGFYGGPWGFQGVDKWDDGVFPGIKMIIIYQGKKGDVRSIQIVYCGNDGDLILSGKHGHEDTHTKKTIELDYPSEYLVRVTGFHRWGKFLSLLFADGILRVRSLCFFSNKKKYGPFGKESGTYFSTEKDGKDGKVIGFHGRDGPYLFAIGMHMEYSS